MPRILDRIGFDTSEIGTHPKDWRARQYTRALRFACQEIASNIWRAPKTLEGVPDVGMHPGIWRGSGDLGYIGRLNEQVALLKLEYAQKCERNVKGTKTRLIPLILRARAAFEGRLKR